LLSMAGGPNVLAATTDDAKTPELFAADER
jgi:hypothetical protein